MRDTNKTSGFRLRQLWLDIHLWLGAGLAILLIPLSLTGSALVWRESLDRLSHPERYAVSGAPARLAPSAYVSKARAALGPAMSPAKLSLPRSASDPVVVSARGRAAPGGRPPMTNVWLEPSDGHVLSSGPGMAGAVRFMHNLHGHLFIPGIGRKVVGWLGWAMLVSCLTGIWLWWPRRGPPWLGLRWRRSTSLNINLHHLVGLWVAVPLAVLCATGVYISFPKAGGGEGAREGRPEMSRPARLEQASGEGRRTGRENHAAGGPALDIDRVAAAALVRSPGGRLATISLPGRAADPVWQVEVAPAGGGKAKVLRVADRTGEVSEGAPPAADPFARLMRQIHDGRDTGVLWRLIITLAGVAPALLGVTGVIMWLRRRRLTSAV